MTALSATRAAAATALGLAAACALVSVAGADASPVAASAVASGIRVAGPGSQPAVDPVTGTAFVATGNPAANIAVIDMAAGTVTATIPVGAGPFALAVNPDTGLVYSANRFADSVSVVDPAAGTVTATIGGLPGTPTAIAADPVTDLVYVELSERGTPVEIAVVDGATSTLATVITLPPGTGDEAVVDGIAVDPDTGTVYASFCSQGCGADIISEATGAVTGHLAGLVSEPPALADDPATGTLYVGGGREVTAYNGTTGAKTAAVDLGNPIGPIVVNASAGTLYVPDGNAIALLKAASLVTTGTLSFHTPYSLAADPATSTLAVHAGGILDLVTLHAPAITSPSHATLTAGHAGSLTLTAAGTPPPAYTRTGRMPYGLALTGNGHISGTPGRRTGGTYHLTITASNGVAPAATQQFTLTIKQAPVITSPARTRFTAGQRHTFTTRASAYPAAAITEHGSLPPGLRFTTRPGGTAIITGTPARSARGKTYRIRITARNQAGHTAQILTIRIAR